MSRYQQAETLNTIIKALINKPNITIKPIPSERFAPAETGIYINDLQYCIISSNMTLGQIIDIMDDIDYIATKKGV